MKRWICLMLLVFPLRVWAARDLQKFANVRLVENPSNDGDSFVVQATNCQMRVRLYFVDSPENIATTDADAKRVREQARYYGITDSKKVLEFGREAGAFTTKLLAEPFTVYTAFANALGRTPSDRVYAFVVTAEGTDLAAALVSSGYARVLGARRPGPGGRSADEILAELHDLETAAMFKRAGLWAATDPNELAPLRAQQRAEERELKGIRQSSSKKKRPAAPVDLNTAAARELQSISGIGPTLATKVISGRPYKSVDDLLRISGVGPRLLEKIRPHLVVNAPSTPQSASP